MINLSGLEALAARAGEPTVEGLNARDLLVSLMPEVAAELRIARAAPPPEDVEAFIKRHRDQEEPRTARWAALDDVLDDYRLHAHLGAPLDETVREGDCDDACGCESAPTVVMAEQAHPPRDRFHVEVFDAGLKPSEWHPVTAPFPSIEGGREFQDDSTSVRDRRTRIVRERRTYTVVEAEESAP